MASTPDVSSAFLFVSFCASSGLFQTAESESLASNSLSSSTFVAWSKKPPQFLEFGPYPLKLLFYLLEHRKNPPCATYFFSADCGRILKKQTRCSAQNDNTFFFQLTRLFLKTIKTPVAITQPQAKKSP
jgi:hypothetical protein